MDSIENIYIISRPCDADTRLACVLSQFRALGIQKCTHFVAIEPDFADPFYDELRHSYKWCWRKDEPYQKGSLGCSLSHIGVCHMALAVGYKRIMVFEDDVWLSSTFVATIDHTIRLLDAKFAGWAVLNLETNDAQPAPVDQMQVMLKTQEGDPIIVRTYGNYCLAGYVLNENAMRLVVDEAMKFGRETDMFYALQLYRRLPSYIVPHGAALVQGNYVSTATAWSKSYYCQLNGLPPVDAFQPLYDAGKVRHLFTQMQSAWDSSLAEILCEDKDRLAK